MRHRSDVPFWQVAAVTTTFVLAICGMFYMVRGESITEIVAGAVVCIVNIGSTLLLSEIKMP